MTESLGPSIPAGGRHQRRLRNYLLDPPFQLKYSGYLVGIAVLLSLGRVLECPLPLLPSALCPEPSPLSTSRLAVATLCLSAFSPEK